MNKEQSKNITNNQEIENIFKLLKEGEEKVKLSEKKDAVLMLGNTGSGKSTLSLFLTGVNLTAIQQSGTFLIQDQNDKISINSTVTSKTLFPDLMLDPETNTVFYDLPGFEDTRSASHDIAINYFIKKLADHLESVKLVLVVNHSSLTPGVDRGDFIKLLKHVTELIPNVNKFKNSFALVATKVDNPRSDEECDDDGNCSSRLLIDNNIIINIANFLTQVKNNLNENLNDLALSSNNKLLYENSIKTINILLEKDSLNYIRIGIFRKPLKPKVLNDIPLLQKEKNHINKIINQKLKFTQKNDSDFRYTISDSSKSHVSGLIEKINDNVWRDTSQIVDKIKFYYSSLYEKISNKTKSLMTIKDPIHIKEAQKYSIKPILSGYNITSNLVAETKNLTNVEQLARKIKNTLDSLGIKNCKKNVLAISHQAEYLNFLQTVSDKNLPTRPWATLFQTIVTDLSNQKQNIQRDINGSEKDINNKINATLENIANAVQLYYENKVDSLPLHQSSYELNQGYHIFKNMTEESRKINNTQVLATKIKDNIIKLDLQSSGIKQEILNLSNNGKN